MNPIFNESVYGGLLAEVTPKMIDIEEGYNRLIVIAERLAFKRNRTPEECALYKLLVMLIETYEAQNYPMDQVAPRDHFKVSPTLFT